MSQAGILHITDGILPPDIPDSFHTDINSPAIPAAHILNIFGGKVTTNNINGIQTDGSSGGNTVTVELTNRITGTAITTDGVTPVTVYTFPLGGTPGVYLFTANLVVFDVTDALGASYVAYAAVRTTGLAGILLSSNSGFTTEENPALIDLDLANTVVGNNLILSVTGLAGKTIHYSALTTYILAT